MMKVVRFLSSIKHLIFLTVIATLFFSYLLFPFSDLSDLASSLVLQQTNVYLQIESLGVNLLPPGVELEKVFVEAPQMPGIKAESIRVNPYITGAINKKPYGRVVMTGLMRGEADIRVSGAPKGEGKDALDRYKIELSAKKMSLSEIRELANLPIQIEGRVDLEAQVVTDAVAFFESSDISMLIKNFEMPPSSLETAMGPYTLPALSLGQVELKAHVSDGTIYIDTSKIGRETDDVSGVLQGGKISYQMQRTPTGGMAPFFGAYEFQMDLKLKARLIDQFGKMLELFNVRKLPLADGAQYKFKVFGAQLGGNTPPSFQSLN